jgi:DNA-directed RNA polymerase subunit M/transcription elongation factor TFIIS
MSESIENHQNLLKNINKITSNVQHKTAIIKNLKTIYEKNEKNDFSYEDILYETCFYYNESKNVKNTINFLKDEHLSFNHPLFETISKRIVEMDHFMDKPFEVTEGVNQCHKCNSKRTLSYSRQTRGGDEGMTVYVFCIDCKFRYTMNS